MQVQSSFYQKAFHRYLRTGVPVDVQLKANQDTFETILRDKYQSAPRIATDLTERRIQEIQQAFVNAQQDFPDIEAPDIDELESDFINKFRSMIDGYRSQAHGIDPEKFYDNFVHAESDLKTKFGQDIDPILQPHYGLTHFVWSGGGKDPCGVCAGMHGAILAWSSGIHPPGCGYCHCFAAPYLGSTTDEAEEYPDAIESVYPEFVIMPIARIGRGSVLLGQRLFRSIAQRQSNSRENLTDHGILRSQQRKISAAEEQEAIRSATADGNIITKTGKYGTPQLHYRGSNGITVIVETSGRNAGKVITLYRH